MKPIVVKNSQGIAAFLIGLGYTRTKVKQLLKHGAVEVNGNPVMRHDYVLSPGDTVSIRREKRPEATPPMGIKVVYEDNAIIVIEKPAGLLTIATEKEKTKTAYYQINEFLKQRSPDARERVFIVHRLDRDTSGLIVFAKNEAVKRRLQKNWKDVEKRYYAVVEGVPPQKEGEIRSHLSETGALKVYSGRGTGEAKYAITKYRILESGRNALLDIILVTGRKNQIRVHLADTGHPVIGDKKYGAKTDPLKRLALHAYLLSLKHPVTGKPLVFKSPMPDRLRMLVQKKRS